MAELAASGRRTRKDSVESLVRNFIQKQKIDMANEVIDAGRFDMQTSMDERRATLEALLQVRGGEGREVGTLLRVREEEEREVSTLLQVRGEEAREEGEAGYRVRPPHLDEASC